MRYFDLQFGSLPKSKDSHEIVRVGFFANMFLVLSKTHDVSWYKRQHTKNIILKSLFLLAVFALVLFSTVLVVDVATSDFTLFRYFQLFSEHEAIVRRMFVWAGIALFVSLVTMYLLFFREVGKYIKLGTYKETVLPPTNLSYDEISPSNKVDVWEMLSDDAQRVMLIALDCAHYWRHGTLSGVHVLKCLALYCGHSQHVFLRFGVDATMFTKHLHEIMAQIPPDQDGDWDYTYLHILLSRAYKIAVESGERVVSSLSVFEALLAHDAMVRDMFNDMGIDYEDVASLIELERVHVKNEQFGALERRVHGLPTSFSFLTLPVSSTREYIATISSSKFLTVAVSNEVTPDDVFFLASHILRMQGKRWSVARISLEKIVKRYGLISSFVVMRKLLDKYFTSRLVCISEGVYMPLISLDDSREYSLATYAREISQHLKSEVIGVVDEGDVGTLKTMELLGLPVVNLSIEAQTAQLLRVMDIVGGIEKKFGVLLGYDAILVLALEIAPLSSDPFMFRNFVVSLSHSFSHITKSRNRVLVTAQTIRSYVEQ